MKQNSFYLICKLLTVLLESKTEKWKSQCEQGQPIEPTRGLFCTCEVVDSATILTSQAVFCFPSEPNIPEGPKYKKNINTNSMRLVYDCDSLLRIT